jgi:UDP-N-acetylglucosamine 1-carboxyvinyltransferase
MGRDFAIRAPGGLRGAPIFLDEPSVTGTENAIMAAVLAPGRTVLRNSACEPHVQDLCRLLVRMGARIEGIGSNVLTIEGVDRLGGCEHEIGPDHIEVASFIGLAAATRGGITVTGVEADDLHSIQHAFSRLGVHFTVEGRDLHVAADQAMEVVDDIGGQIPKIEDGPWPQVPADITSILVAVATQARGTVLIYEKMFENRLVFTDKLVTMGARIVLCDPHRCVVTGPSQLYGERMESPDIRAGMAMLIASLAATGTTVIGNVGQIDRGYERIDERLRNLGARIDRVLA